MSHLLGHVIIQVVGVLVAAADSREQVLGPRRVVVVAARELPLKRLLHLCARRVVQAIDDFLMRLDLTLGQVELSQAQAFAYVIANVAVEEQREALDAQVSVTVLGALCRVNLWVRVQVTNSLDVNNDQLVVGVLEREVAERVRGQPEVEILDKAGI